MTFSFSLSSDCVFGDEVETVGTDFFGFVCFFLLAVGLSVFTFLTDADELFDFVAEKSRPTIEETNNKPRIPVETTAKTDNETLLVSCSKNDT